MPNYEPDFDLVSTWIYQSLVQNSALVAAHGGTVAKARFYDAPTIPDDPTHPYVYWTRSVMGRPEYLGISGKIAREQYRVHVRSRMPQPSVNSGLGGLPKVATGGIYSLRNMTAWAKEIYNALVGHSGLVVESAADVRLGMITESVYSAPWEADMEIDGVRFVERGVTLEVMVQYI